VPYKRLKSIKIFGNIFKILVKINLLFFCCWKKFVLLSLRKQPFLESVHIVFLFLYFFNFQVMTSVLLTKSINAWWNWKEQSFFPCSTLCMTFHPLTITSWLRPECTYKHINIYKVIHFEVWWWLFFFIWYTRSIQS